VVLSIVNHGNDLPGKVVGNHLSPTKVTILGTYSGFFHGSFGKAGTVGVGELRYVGEGWGKVSQGRQGELCLFPFWYVG
jgi:hypothetical protein